MLPIGENQKTSSLKDSWTAALASFDTAVRGRGTGQFSPMHQNSGASSEWSRQRLHIDGRVRYPRRISFGGSLYLLVQPQGGRDWHDQYRYGGKRKTLFLGACPDVPTALAQRRHRAARRLLAAGIDLSRHKRELRRMEGGSCLAAVGGPEEWLQTG